MSPSSTEAQDQQSVAHCGNVWMLAATIAQGLLTEESTEPHVLTIDEEGTLHAVGPRHPDYEKHLLDAGFVSTVSRNTEVARLAGRIRDAAMRRRMK